MSYLVGNPDCWFPRVKAQMFHSVYFNHPVHVGRFVYIIDISGQGSMRTFFNINMLINFFFAALSARKQT